MTKLMRHSFFLLFLLSTWVACTPKNFQIKQKSASFTHISSETPEDPKIVNLIAPYKKELDVKMDQVIGSSEVEMTKEKGPENLLCNFVADLMLAEINLNTNYEKVDIAFGSSGGLRNSLPKGKITKRNVYELMPFDNEIVLLTIKGSDLLKLMEFLGTKGSGIFSGGSFVINKDKTVSETKVKGEALNTEKSYRIITSDYIANGGDNLKFLGQAIKRENTGILFRDMIMSYIQKQKEPITAKIDGRMTR